MTGGPHRSEPSPPPLGVTTWLIVSATLAGAGWVLSALHQLNAGGYACFLVLGALAAIIYRRGRLVTDSERLRWRRVARRFKRPLPRAYLLLACLSLLGALLYLPVNYDALAYRVPRVLHWLAHREWHWVHTPFPRLNVRACGYEWIMAPLLALTRTSRWIFLPSFISFLLLPGLFYSMLTRFGVKRRVAWHWMWILSSGFCYVAQAGSIANDLFGAAYVLAAFDFALRMRAAPNVRDLRLFMLAAALMVGAKASNFPLLLPLFLLTCPNWRLLLVKPAQNFLVVIVAAAASFFPTAILNLKYAGDWTGMRLEGPMKSPLDQMVINVTTWLILNLTPPAFPFSANWTHFMQNTLHLSNDPVRCFQIPELAGEEDAGIGLGVVLLLVFSVLASRRLFRAAGTQNTAHPLPAYWKFILWSPYISLLVYAVKAQVVNSAARLISPYYALLIVPILLFGFHEQVLKRHWWKPLVAFAFLMSFGVIILPPVRPLWPAEAVLARLSAAHPSSALLTRARTVYQLYRERPRGYAPLAAALPTDETVFGFVTFDDPETSLWWPLGSRRIEHVTESDTTADLEARGIHYIMAPFYSSALSVSAKDLMVKYDATVFAKVPLIIRSYSGLMDWYVLKINSQPHPPSTADSQAAPAHQ